MGKNILIFIVFIICLIIIAFFLNSYLPKKTQEPEYQIIAREFIQTYLKSDYQPFSINLEFRESEDLNKDLFNYYYIYEWDSSSEKFNVMVGYDDKPSLVALLVYSIQDATTSWETVKKYFNIPAEIQWTCKDTNEITVCRSAWTVGEDKFELEQMKSKQTTLSFILCKPFKGSERYEKGCFIQI